MDRRRRVSAPLLDGNFLGQGVNVSRAPLGPEDLFTISLSGEVLCSPQGARPARELHIHSEIEKARPVFNAVLRVHPKVPVLLTIAEDASLKMVINYGYLRRTGVPIYPDIANI